MVRAQSPARYTQLGALAGVAPRLLSVAATPLYPGIRDAKTPALAASVCSAMCDVPSWLVCGPAGLQESTQAPCWLAIRRRTRAGQRVGRGVLALLSAVSWLDPQSLASAACVCRSWWTVICGFSSEGQRQRLVVLPGGVTDQSTARALTTPVNLCVVRCTCSMCVCVCVCVSEWVVHVYDVLVRKHAHALACAHARFC